MLLPPYAYNCAPPQNPAARSSGLPWYGAVILAVGVLVLILGALALAWHRLGPQMAAYRALAAKKLPPGKGSLGKAITLVLTDVEGSTELWEWDTELMSQAVDMHDRWGEGGGRASTPPYLRISCLHISQCGAEVVHSLGSVTDVVAPSSQGDARVHEQALWL